MKIVVACDGSQASSKALHLVSNLAWKKKDFLLLHAAPCFAARKIQDADIVELNSDIAVHAEKLLDEARNIVGSDTSSCKTKSFSGDPVKGIIEASRGAKLLVMGTRGLNPTRGFALGSVADALLRHAECSILLCPPDIDTDLAKENLQILVGYDDTESSEAVCKYLANFAPDKVAGIDLVSVVQMSFYYGLAYSLTALGNWVEQRGSLEESLNSAAGELSKRLPASKICTELITDADDIAVALKDAATQHKSNILAVGSKGKGLVDTILLGSVSNKLAHLSAIPLLIVR